MTKLYTKLGDDGYTGLLGEGRIPKYDPITEAIGAIDETTAALGIARALCADEQIKSLILAIQRDLYHIMAETAATKENIARFRKIDAERVRWLEDCIEEISNKITLPNEFIVPGDSLAGAALSLARTITRRAERRVAFLVHEQKLENNEILRYLNRLSSACFLLELFENHLKGNDSPTLAKNPK